MWNILGKIGKMAASGAKHVGSGAKKAAAKGYKYTAKRRKRKKEIQRIANGEESAEGSIAKKLVSLLASGATSLLSLLVPLLLDLLPWLMGMAAMFMIMATIAAAVSVKEIQVRIPAAMYQHTKINQDTQLLQGLNGSNGQVVFNQRTNHYEMATGKTPTGLNKLYFVYYATEAENSKWYVEYAIDKNNQVTPVRQTDHLADTVDGYLFNQAFVPEILAPKVISKDKLATEQYDYTKIFTERSEQAIESLSLSANLMYLLDTTLNQENNGLSGTGFFFAEQFAKPVYHYAYDPTEKDPATGKIYSSENNASVSEYTDEEAAFEASQNGATSSDYTSVPYIAYQARAIGTYINDNRYKSTAGKGSDTADPSKSKSTAKLNYDQSHVDASYDSSVAHGDKYNSLAEAQFISKYRIWTNKMDAENLAAGGTKETSVTGTTDTSSDSTTSKGGKIAILDAILGKTIGNGQCYAVSSYYVYKLTGGIWSLGAGIAGKKLTGPDIMDAKAIGTLDWNDITGKMAGKFKVTKNPTYAELQPGDIVNFDGGPVDPTAGHTAVISSVDGNSSITCYSQNPGAVKLMHFKITQTKIGTSNSLSTFHISSVVHVNGQSDSASSSTTSLDSSADPTAIYPKGKGVYNGKYDTGVLSSWTRKYDTSYSPTILTRYQLQSDVKQLIFRSHDFWVTTVDRKDIPFDIKTLTNLTGNTLENANGTFAKENDLSTWLSGNYSGITGDFATTSTADSAIAGGAEFTKPSNGNGIYLDTNAQTSVRDEIVSWSLQTGYNPNFITALVVALTSNGSANFSGGKYDFANDGGGVGNTNTSDAAYSSSVQKAISAAGSSSVSYNSSSTASGVSATNFNDIEQSLTYFNTTYLAPAIAKTKTPTGNVTKSQMTKLITRLIKTKSLSKTGDPDGSKGGMGLSNDMKSSILRYESIFDVKKGATGSEGAAVKFSSDVASNLKVFTYDSDGTSGSGTLGDTSAGTLTKLTGDISPEYPYGHPTSDTSGIVGYLDPESTSMKVPIWVYTVQVEPIQVVGRINQQGNSGTPDGASTKHPYAIVRNGTAASEDSDGNLIAGTQSRKVTANSSASTTATATTSSDSNDSYHKTAAMSVSEWVKANSSKYDLTTAKAKAYLINIHNEDVAHGGASSDKAYTPSSADIQERISEQTAQAKKDAKLAITEAKDKASVEDANDTSSDSNDPANGAGVIYERGLADYGFGTIFKVMSTKWNAVNVQVQADGTGKIARLSSGNTSDSRYEIIGVSSPFGNIDLTKQIVSQKDKIDTLFAGGDNSFWTQFLDDASFTTTVSASRMSVLKEHEDDSLTPDSGYDFVASDKPIITQNDISLKNMFGVDYLRDYLENYSTYVPNSLVSPTDIAKRYTNSINPQLSNQTADDQVARIWNKLIGTTSTSSSSDNSSTSTSTTSSNAVAQQIYTYLTSKMGFSSAGAAGAVAIAERESSFNPKADNPSGGVHGIFQWSGWSSTANGNRWANAPAGKVDTIENELALMAYELAHAKKQTATIVGSATNSTDGAVQAAEDWSQYYEGVSLSNSQTKLGQIGTWAKSWYNTFTSNGKNIVNADPSKIGNATSTVDGSSTSNAVGVTNSWGNGISLIDKIKQSLSISGFYNSVLGLFSKSSNDLNGGAMFSTTDIYNDRMVLANGDQIVKNGNSYSIKHLDGSATDSISNVDGDYYLGIYKAVKQKDGTYKYKLDNYPGIGGTETYTDGWLARWPWADYTTREGIVHQHISTDGQTAGNAIIGGADAYSWTKYSHPLTDNQAEIVIKMWIASLESRNARPVYTDEVNDTFNDYDLGRIVENHYASQLAAVFASSDTSSTESSTQDPTTTSSKTPVSKTKKLNLLAVQGYIKYNNGLQYNPGLIINASGKDVDSVKAGKVISVGDVSGTVPGGLDQTAVTIQSDDGSDTLVYIGITPTVSTGDKVKAGRKIGTANDFMFASSNTLGLKYTDIRLANVSSWNDPAVYFGVKSGQEITLLSDLNGYNPNELGSSSVPTVGQMKDWPVDKNGKNVTWSTTTSSNVTN